jgi:hypothetical protein
MHQVSDILNKHSREVDSAKSEAQWNVLRCLRKDLGLLLCLVMHHVDCDLSIEPSPILTILMLNLHATSYYRRQRTCCCNIFTVAC